jgi:hypothetical protein
VIRPHSWLPAVALCALATGLAPLPPARADVGPAVLEDSTVFESFRLPNGLRVATRHVPGCQSVDVTVAYDFGRGDEPPGKEGLSALLAELEFYGATAETPERTREEMPGLRPSGWDIAVTPRVTRFSEIGPERLLPGLIHQAADRMRGVRVTQTAFKRALGAVRADLDTAYRVNVALALHNAARTWAAGNPQGALPPETGGRGLQGASVGDVQRRLNATFVPSNAVLAVVGNLRKIPLRALIQTEFGSIPAGSPRSRTVPARLDSTTRVVQRAEVSRPMGVLGLIAPALDDTTHPAFYMELVLVGGHCVKRWGPPEAPLTTRFNYSLYDDPELARFYPPVGPAETDPALLRSSYINTLNELSSGKVTPQSYFALWRGLDWLLGGPIPSEIFDRVLREPGALHTLATGTAVRELWGGEPFWSQYRERFQRTVGTPYPEWYRRLLSPQYMVDLLFVPPK